MVQKRDKLKLNFKNYSNSLEEGKWNGKMKNRKEILNTPLTS